MANAKPSRPGIDQTAGAMEINILKNEKIVKLPDGRVVKRAEFDTGTIRETEVFHEDHMDAPDFVDTAKEEAELAAREELKAELRAELEAEAKAAAKTPAPKKPEPKAKGGK